MFIEDNNNRKTSGCWWQFVERLLVTAVFSSIKTDHRLTAPELKEKGIWNLKFQFMSEFMSDSHFNSKRLLKLATQVCPSLRLSRSDDKRSAMMSYRRWHRIMAECIDNIADNIRITDITLYLLYYSS